MGLSSIDTRNYEEAVVMSVKPVIISMWSKAMPLSEKNDKILEEIANEYGDYVCRMLEIQENLDDKLGIYKSPCLDNKRWMCKYYKEGTNAKTELF